MIICVNDFNVWQYGTPVINMAGDGDFNTWDLLAPLVDQDESNVNAQPRRRVSDF